MPVEFEVISAEWRVIRVGKAPLLGLEQEVPNIYVDSGTVVTFEVNVEIEEKMGFPYTGFLWLGPGQYEWREGTLPGTFTTVMPGKIPMDPIAPPMIEYVELHACSSEPPPLDLCDQLLLCELYYTGEYCDPLATTGTTSGILAGLCPTDLSNLHTIGCTSPVPSGGW